jgi:uncharacterized protein YjbI with pentapeptide repeats
MKYHRFGLNNGRGAIALSLPLIMSSGVALSSLPVRAEKPEHLRQFKQTRICVDCNLKKANLTNAPLTGAFLRKTNLTEANLRGADLRFAILREVNLHRADLTNADLTGAVFRDVNLDDAILTGAKLPLGYRQRPNPSQDFRAPDVKIQLPEKPDKP